MDPFEQARRVAARVHSAAVALGADPTSPMQLVERAAQHLNVSLEWVQPTDPMLFGGVASFDSMFAIVRCSNEGVLGTRALLAGHELGHAALEGGGACSGSTESVDASQSVERAPVGLQRVEDYGPRSRNELRANVFARELVFPRTVARRMHVDEALTSRAIAEKLGLDLSVVRQQLLDALLLPEAPEAPSSNNAPERAPTERQGLGAAHRGSPLLLEAGPGTGKTATLVDRVGSLLNEGIDPATILVLTFSNKAAGELLERISARFAEAAPKVWIGTFHAFGLDFIRRHYDRIGRSPRPRLFDRSDAVAMMEDYFPTYPMKRLLNLWDPTLPLREILNGISRAKDELIGASRYQTEATKLLADALTEEQREAAEKCGEVAFVYAEYERLLRESDGLDFGDLIKLPAELLQSDPHLRHSVRLRYRHVLVDEYQDVNRASGLLLKEIAGTGERLWVVGDARQSIYRFRGASSENMRRFEEDFPGATRTALDVNFRSTPEIARTFVSFAVATSGPLMLGAKRDSINTTPSIRSFETDADEASGIADAILSYREKGIPLRNQAVLCRSNRRMAAIASAIEQRGIPLLHLGSLFERDEVRDLLSVLSLFTDRFGDALVRLAPKYGCTLQDTYEITRQLRAAEEGVAAEHLGTLALSVVSESGRVGIERLNRELAAISKSDSPWAALGTYLLDSTRIAADISQATTVASQMRGIAIWQLMNFARDPGPPIRGQPIRRMLERIRQIVLFSEDRELRHVPQAAMHLDGVRLMTVHGSKGLEFETVHIPSLTTVSFPTPHHEPQCPLPSSIEHAEQRKESHKQEEAALFFVALSRARSHLSVTRPRRMANGKNRTESPFLATIADTVSTIDLPAAGRAAARTMPIGVEQRANERLTLSMVKAYDRCPRRFFYTHALELGGGRTKTVFHRTHDVVHDFLRWLRAARTESGFTPAGALEHFAALWNNEPKLALHPLEIQYRALARGLVEFAIQATRDVSLHAPESLSVNVGGTRIWLEDNLIGVSATGLPVLHHLRSGRRRNGELREFEYAVEQLSAEERFGNAFELFSVQLSNRNVEAVPRVDSAKAYAKLAHQVADLRAGAFEPSANARDRGDCPRCPHFFACGPVASGGLKKK